MDPEELTDDQWAKLFQQWVYTERIKIQTYEDVLEKVVKSALFEVAAAIFGKKN